MQKLALQSHMLPRTGTEDTFKDAIRDIYNFKVPASQKVGFF